MSTPSGPVLTLEPFIDGVREGIEASGWVLSGLQKTSSTEFAGRWAGESTRSAYLFFHRPGGGEAASLEGFLDETTRGLQGNLSLVLDGPGVDRIGDAGAALSAAAAAARRRVERGLRVSVSLKLRVDDPELEPESTTSELRVKVRVPQSALRGGVASVAEIAARVVRAFERLLEEPELARYSDSQ